MGTVRTSASAAWYADTQHRIAIDEGEKLSRYRDSKGIWTLGIGYNLERGDAGTVLRACGIDYAAVMADRPITTAQAATLFVACFSPIVSEARASLPAGIFDSLSDARRFVVCDLNYNLGAAGWLDFSTSRSLLAEAQAAKSAGRSDAAHTLFGVCAAHLAASAWAAQTGDRARRNVAMITSGEYVDPAGNGTS